MREYRFRGKRKDTGEWVYGYYSYHNDSYEIESDKDVPSGWRTVGYKVIPEAVGQYINDSFDGEELYEGDYVMTVDVALVSPIWLIHLKE